MSLFLALLLAAAPPEECEAIAAPPQPAASRLGDAELVTIERAGPLVHFSAGLGGPGDRTFLSAAAAAITAQLEQELQRREIHGVKFSAAAGTRALRIDGSCPKEALSGALAALYSVLDKPKVTPLPRRFSKDDPRLAELAIKRLLGASDNLNSAHIPSWIAAHKKTLVLGLLGPIGELDPPPPRFTATATAAPKIEARGPSQAKTVLVDVPGKHTASFLFLRKTTDGDAAARLVLLEALGTGGKLRALLETPSGAARDPYTAAGPSRYAEAAIVGLDAPAKDAGAVVRDVLEAFAELRRETWGADETAAARRASLARAKLEFARPDRVLAAAVDARLVDRPAADAWKRLELLAAVDHLAVRRAAEALLAEDGWQILVLAEATPSLIGTLTTHNGALEVWAYDDLAELLP